MAASRSTRLGKRPSDGPITESGLATLAGALGLTLAYGLLHGTIRYAASGNLGEDDPVDVLFAQDLAFGYRADQPPLYEWLLFAFQRVFGFDVLPHLVLKYGLLTILAGFIFLSARRVTGSGLWALITVESLALIYSLSWRMHEAFTSQMIGMAAASATAYAMMRVVGDGESRSPLTIAGLGLSAGFGLLSGWPYALMLASLLAAVMLQPRLRDRLIRLDMLLALLVAAVVVSPFVGWLIADPARLGVLWNGLAAPRDLSSVIGGLGDALGQPIAYLFPLIAIVPLVFWGWHRRVWQDFRRPTADDDRARLSRLLRDQALAAIALLLAAAVIFGADSYPVHAVAPVFIVTPVWLIATAQLVPVAGRRVRLFAVLSGAIAAIALMARLLNLYALDPHCGVCRWGIPYDGLAQAIEARGFRDGTIIGADVDLVGNLRRYFPAARLEAPGVIGGGPKRRQPRRSSLFVWETTQPSGRQKVKYPGLKPTLPDAALNAEANDVTVPWRHLWRPTGYRTSSFRFVIIPPE